MQGREREIQDEIDHLSDAADDLIDLMLASSGATQDELRQKAVATQEVIKALHRELKAIQVNSLNETVTALQGLVVSEAARQADIAGRIKELVARVKQSSGLPAGHAGETASPQVLDAGNLPETGAVLQPTTPVSPDKRYTSLDLLHPRIRDKVTKLISDLTAANVPMKVFESFRSPERQAFLYSKGRFPPNQNMGKVTKAQAWHSYHQYGLAVDMVIDHPDHTMWETGNATVDAWWAKYHELADKNGLEPLSWELPHVQLKGVKTSQLLAGDEPGSGDDSWQENFAEAVARWPGNDKPPGPAADRPPLIDMINGQHMAEAGIDWAALPAAASFNWGNPLQGKEWRVDNRGIYLRDSPNVAQRTPGDPTTATKAINLYADAIAEASQAFQIPPELIVMTIATETGMFKNDDFTGPRTFRWEAGFVLTNTGDAALDGKQAGDYSAGPMQVMSSTAREMNNKSPKLRFKNETTLKWFKTKPATPPKALGLYDGRVCIMIGASYIAHQAAKTGLNPILVAAAYNAGSIRATGTNSWGIFAHGDHLDRAARWYGDACAAFSVLGR